MPEPDLHAPGSRPTLRLTTHAMACEFAVVLNRDGHAYAEAASDALERVHALEECMTVYRPGSELSCFNRPTEDPFVASDDLFRVLEIARRLHHETSGCFDPTARPLIKMWRTCRAGKRLPEAKELADALQQVGADRIELKRDAQSGCRIIRRGAVLDLGAIGKGFALDEAGIVMRERGAAHWLLSGGRSSVLASGQHEGQGGWPVGIGNPVFTNQRLGTLLLQDEAMATSGSNIQYFRHQGRRYGHILDPRTGWPADTVASVTVLAPSAAEADALSTAFFTGGLEIAQAYCDNHPEVSALLIPFPASGKRLELKFVNLPPERFYRSDDQDPMS